MAKTPLAPGLSILYHEEKDTLILSLFARLDALGSKVNKTSQNSCKPPSSDGLVKYTSSLREPSGNPPGGQSGHKGTTLKGVGEPTHTAICARRPTDPRGVWPDDLAGHSCLDTLRKQGTVCSPSCPAPLPAILSC